MLEAWRAEGVPVLSGGDVTTPFEVLCGSRSLQEFSFDLFEIPEKVVSAMEEIAPHLSVRAVTRAKKRGYPMVWVGGWRTAPSLLSPAIGVTPFAALATHCLEDAAERDVLLPQAASERRRADPQTAPRPAHTHLTRAQMLGHEPPNAFGDAVPFCQLRQ